LIVVDTNLIMYLLIQGERTDEAERVFKADSQWLAPFLWRSEFRNALAFYMRRGALLLERGVQIMQEAESLMQGNEFVVPSQSVLALTAASSCSAYDCEFVALAQDFGVPLVTADRQVLSEFPTTAVSPEGFNP